MSKKTLTRPLTVLIVGCIDDISKSVGKLFDNPRYADDRNTPDISGLDLIVVITKAVSHRLIEHWHAFGRDHDILVINGDSKSTVIARLNEMATILEPQKSEPRLNAVPISYDPNQHVEVAPQPTPRLHEPPQSSTAPAGSSITAFMAEVQGLQKGKEEAEAVALKEMERADRLERELEDLRKSIPSDESVADRIEQAVEKRADGLAIQKTREIDAELKQTRKTLEDKIKEVGRVEKRREKAEEAKTRSQEEIDRLEQVIDKIQLERDKWSMTPKKLRLLSVMHLAAAAMLLSDEGTLSIFERMLSKIDDYPEASKLMEEVIMNTGGRPPKEVVEGTLAEIMNLGEAS